MNIADIFKQAKDVQARANAMQEQLALIEAEGIAGAGLVKLVLNGKAELKSLIIDPSLLRPEARDIIQDLVVAAHTDAKAKVERRVGEEMQKLARDMGLPPGMVPGT
ncbi:MAG: YbaB/EbfC family nucleoid-associated protein [Alphaproteobacteria bacterium]|nr:YbaB/EbfC family nucleoid-associated protein [Alphaproteobacteria bacterium]MBV9062444.1 YbaB/EbfC family nucleoid-associated protein [Alphaproteobacteria bacterium]